MAAKQWTPPPNWPAPPSPGWSPPPGWQPPSEWGPAPSGWNFYPGGGNWFSQHKVLTGVLGVFLLLIVLSIAGGGASDTVDTADSTASKGPSSPPAESPPPATAPPQAAAPPPSPPPPPAAPSAAAPAFPGQTKDDTVVQPGGEIRLSGWTTTSAALKKTPSVFGKQLCTAVSMTNRDEKTQQYASFSWKLQSPSGDVKDTALSESNNEFGVGELAPGGVKTGTLCFDDPGVAGVYVVLWEPDLFSSTDRGAWLNKL